jgi:N12 class adenine-specific DNA methylase
MGMQSKDEHMNDMRESWARASNDALLKAAVEDWDEYSAEAQHIINEEISKRQLDIQVRPTIGEPIKPNEPILTQWLRAVRLIFLLILIVVPFGLINLGLWSYYEWRDNQALARINNLERLLDAEKNWLVSAEKSLQNKQSELATQEYTALYAEYEDRVRKYNEKVEEYNSLIEEDVSRWYVIPIPIRK